MRDYSKELESRVAFLQQALKDSGASGFVYNNSGGKDCTLVGILCKKACENTVCLCLPCHSRRNYGEDLQDAMTVAEQFGISARTIDLTDVRAAVVNTLGQAVELNDMALANIAPRLRMISAYAVAASENRLVVGTGNRSEAYMGYFTKWGDGAYDINPIADLTVTEIYEFLRFLNAPSRIIEKAPSAGLFDGQTDEGEMGVTYAAIDKFLFTGEASEHDRAIIERYHARSAHKRQMPLSYSQEPLL